MPQVDERPDPTASPRDEYARRLRRYETEAAETARRDRTVANLRLAAVGAGVLVAWLALGARLLPPWWILLPAAAFLALAIHHDRILRRQQRTRRAAQFYRAGMDRLDDCWAGRGQAGDRFLDPAHPYAADLDLFGPGSLFELLCTARTRGGEETLAAWLCAPASGEVVRARQEAVGDLRPRVDLREELAVLGEDVRAAVDAEALTAWGAAPRVLSGRWPRVASAALGACTAAAGLAWLAGFSALPFALMVLIERGFAEAFATRVRQVVRSVEQPGREAALLSLMLACVEGERFDAPLLRALGLTGEKGGPSPAARLARLQRLVGLLDSQRSPLFAPVAFILLWPLQLAFAIEEWRAETGCELGRWIGAIGEFEALCALAAYAYEHPQDPFPELVEGGACFEGEDLAHPLLPKAASVPNDIVLGSQPQFLIVSGSNMSGKSTLLRSIGTNAVLALAGAPVRARRLRITPVTVGASLRIQDSLQTGTSRFYAEITRLRQIVDLTSESRPLLFLLDEILHGTNSHDRRIGAEAVVRTLVERGAMGLVTTHDLALTAIADDLGARAANVHFEDHLEEGKMTFDYRLRPGVIRKSNALELMRAVGLEV
jgi:hypothetical protein